MTAMEIQEADGQTGDDCVADKRARAVAKLDQIARDSKAALDDQGIDIPVFFVIPSSGDAIATFGTPADPDDEVWGRVSEIVSNIVRHTVGLDRVRCRPAVCATTHDQA
jgi:hypothetical protein